MHLCDGGGFFRSEPSGEQILHPGDTVILIPGIAHSYGARPGHAWEEFWILLEGPFVSECLEKGLFPPDNPVLRHDHPEFWQQIADLHATNPSAAPSCDALALALFGLSAASAMEPHAAEPSPVGRITADMLERIADPAYDFASMARTLGYSPVHMRRLFKSVTGHTPVEYFTRLKIEEVKRRLIYTSESVQAIANDLGWKDDAYFRRVFRRMEGRSPFEWRAMHKAR